MSQGVQITFRNVQGVSGEMYLFYFDITFFWKMILNFRLLENNELICPFYACFLFLKILTLGKRFSSGLGFEPAPLWTKSESHTTRLWRSVSPGNFKRLTNFLVFFHWNVQNVESYRNLKKIRQNHNKFVYFINYNNN